MYKQHKLNTGSIDRIDLNKPYSKNNIQITCKYINLFKIILMGEQTKQNINYNNRISK